MDTSDVQTAELLDAFRESNECYGEVYSRLRVRLEVWLRNYPEYRSFWNEIAHDASVDAIISNPACFHFKDNFEKTKPVVTTIHFGWLMIRAIGRARNRLRRLRRERTLSGSDFPFDEIPSHYGREEDILVRSRDEIVEKILDEMNETQQLVLREYLNSQSTSAKILAKKFELSTSTVYNYIQKFRDLYQSRFNVHDC